MDKLLFILSFLGLLIVSRGVAEKVVYDDIGMVDELESLDIEEDESDFEFFDIPPWRSERGGKVLVNVDSFGAVGDGVSDDTEVNYVVFLRLFDILCQMCLVVEHLSFMTTLNAKSNRIGEVT